MRRGPLSGLTVVALEQAVAAPYCTLRLADAGARILKIERPSGDFARRYDDATPAGSSYFVWLNRGKESVVLDIGQPEGRRQLRALIAGADIFVQNLKPGSLARLDLAIEDLRRAQPELICCSISGYGDDGPLAQRKAYDLLVQAESGLASITGGPQEPARVGVSLVDIGTGATAHAAILEALIERGRTGAGADIRISMFDVIAEWLTVPLLNAEAGHPPQRIGLAHPSISPYGVFSTADGRSLLISVQNDREWRTFCTEVMRRPELIDDPLLATVVLRNHNRPHTEALVAGLFGETSGDELIERLNRADVAFAELNDMAGLARHPHLSRVEVETEAGMVGIPRPPTVITGTQRLYGAVPSLGQHTDAVLGELAAKAGRS